MRCRGSEEETLLAAKKNCASNGRERGERERHC